MKQKKVGDIFPTDHKKVKKQVKYKKHLNRTNKGKIHPRYVSLIRSVTCCLYSTCFLTEYVLFFFD